MLPYSSESLRSGSAAHVPINFHKPALDGLSRGCSQNYGPHLVMEYMTYVGVPK